MAVAADDDVVVDCDAEALAITIVCVTIGFRQRMSDQLRRLPGLQAIAEVASDIRQPHAKRKSRRYFSHFGQYLPTQLRPQIL